jgi:Protein of unknown function VcgC/VcgE (DUF2780)
MKKLLSITLLFALCAQSQADWLDDISNFFGGGNEKKEEVTKEESANSSAGTAQLLKTGLALLPMLTQQLGITESQAGGGLGALLTTAQSLMAADQFSSLTSAIPNASGLMKAVPAFSKSSSSKNDLVGSALSLAGENSDKLTAGADLVSQFSSLGLDSGMISKFTGVTSDYLTQSGKTEEAGSLTSVISDLF